MAASATAGILVGISRGVGDPSFAIVAGGNLWMRNGTGSPSLLLAVGAGRHLLLFGALGLLWRAISDRRSFATRVGLAVLLTVALVGLSPVLPEVIRPVAIDLRTAQRLALEVACVLGLLAGGQRLSS